MQFLHLFVVLFATMAAAKNILLTNDDSWVSTNIRATYQKLKDAGHNVFLVAPVSQRSGFGGKFDVPSSPTLQTDGEFGYVKAGAPSWGHEQNDDHVWYFNGTPSSCVAFWLTYVSPKFFNNITVDLVVSGPNEGTNMSPGMFTLSGTMGATYAAVYRGLPAVAFSGSNSNNSLYTDDLALNDPLSPATIYAERTTEFVNQLFKASGDNVVLPIGVGINVNYPPVGYQSKNESCVAPKWIHSRLTGQFASGADLAYNETSKSFTFALGAWKPLTVCENGDCSLPSENTVVEHSTCEASFSAFNIDYDADTQLSDIVGNLLKPISS